MMRRHEEKQFAQPKSVHAFRARSGGGKDFEKEANVMAFWHHITTGIMPFVSMGKTPPGFSAKIAGDERARAMPLISSVSGRSIHEDSEVICGAVTSIARSLAALARLTHEIVPEVGGDSCRLCGFTTQRLVRIPGWYVQLIPRKDRHWNNSPPAVFLRSRNVWEISMPPELGGARGHARLLRQLGKRGPTGPKFFQQALGKQNPPKHFDFGEYAHAESARIWRVANKWGWTRGDTSRCTEFYSIHRSVRREWALAVLREHIIRELNALLTRLGIRAKIMVEGLSSPEEILAISGKMTKGEMGFAQALEAATKRKLPPI